MTIGIITIHNSHNYGASLQSYALWRFLKECHYDCQLIDLYRPCHKGFITSRIFVPFFVPKISKMGQLYLKLKSFIDKFVSGHDSLSLKFKQFNDIIDTSKPYFSVDQLYSDPPLYDVYITGSDQIWNPSQEYSIEPYFLTFVNNSKSKKISYAASIGLSKLDEEKKKLFKKWLDPFDAISVREKQAKDLLETFMNRKIIQVADPTFLLKIETWQELAVKPNDNSYILVFSLTYRQYLINEAFKIAKELNKRIYVINNNTPKDKRYTLIEDAGPKEWLGWLVNSDIVLTDSFHGTVFSLILGVKNFYSYIPQNSTRGSRIEDLLSTFSLSNHIIGDGCSLINCYDQIDRINVIKTIEEEREKAFQFLFENLR